MTPQIFPQAEYRKLYGNLIVTNRRREKRELSDFACLSKNAKRRNTEPIPDKDNIRPAFAHDADRVIHCRAYARYIDKTQVFFLIENDHITHRVLHVQIVSKISRTLSRVLRLNEDLTEAIALAHDLGHTPFGHAGEEFLAELMRDKGAGTFVHNAQSARVLETLENGGNGLNLTLQVLDGVLGHNGELLQQELRPVDALTWELYDANRHRCFMVPKADRGVYPSTLEGCIVRVADVISYIGRDIEDAIEVELIKREDLPQDATVVLGATNREVIDNLVMDIIHNSVDRGAVCFSEEIFVAMKKLMAFNYERIYHAPQIQEEKRRLRNVFRELFDAFLEDLAQGRDESPIATHIKNHVNSYEQGYCHARIVADFIAGMTDDYLVNQYRERFVPQSLGYRLTGSRPKTSLGIIKI
ncbi:MAG: HD domain-containing protein [Pirellulales bacterium]|nr:HD domain-containing protein [Pirellulales bacterium]